MWFLDDATIGRDTATVLSDLKTIINESKKIGLCLEPSKSEIIILGASEGQVERIKLDFDRVAPGITVVPHAEATLLQAPLTVSGILPAIESKIEALETIGKNLKSVGTHESLFLLKNCLLIPRLLYTLRTSPT